MITWHSIPHRLNLKSHAMSKLEFIIQKFSILRHYSTPLGVINNHRAYANEKRRHDSSPQRKTWLTMEFQSNPIRDSFSWIICRLVVGGCNQPYLFTVIWRRQYLDNIYEDYLHACTNNYRKMMHHWVCNHRLDDECIYLELKCNGCLSEMDKTLGKSRDVKYVNWFASVDHPLS